MYTQCHFFDACAPASNKRKHVLHDSLAKCNFSVVFVAPFTLSTSPPGTLQHSCQPNLFVQNVFVDNHDIRLPWVALFAQV